MNCGKDINYHSETKTDVCLKQLNQKMLNVYLFDPKKLLEEKKGLPSTLLQVPQIAPTKGGYS